MFYKTKEGDTVLVEKYDKGIPKLIRETVTKSSPTFIYVGETAYSRRTGRERGHFSRKLQQDFEQTFIVSHVRMKNHFGDKFTMRILKQRELDFNKALDANTIRKARINCMLKQLEIFFNKLSTGKNYTFGISHQEPEDLDLFLEFFEFHDKVTNVKLIPVSGEFSCDEFEYIFAVEMAPLDAVCENYHLTFIEDSRRQSLLVCCGSTQTQRLKFDISAALSAMELVNLSVYKSGTLSEEMLPTTLADIKKFCESVEQHTPPELRAPYVTKLLEEVKCSK